MSEIVDAQTVLTASGANSDATVRYRRADGRFIDTTLRRLPIEEVLAGMPVREFRAWRGRRHYSGWYWSSTTCAHVVYESRLELARLILADHDPDVVAIAAQPFVVAGVDGTRIRRHIPDLLLERSCGAVTVVDVKSATRRQDPTVAAQFAWTEQICADHGLGFEVWSGTDSTLLGNLRFLAGYRRPGTVRDELAPAVLEAAAAPVRIGDLERMLAESAPALVVRPVILSLLWRSRLTADLSRPLDSDAVVVAGVPT